jgi:hypothetical protein
LEQDRAIRTITASGATLEEAVAQAAALLDLPVRRLEYEVTEKGSPGFLGSGKKDWTIHAYERIVVKKDFTEEGEEDEESVDSAPVIEDVDGDVFVHLSSDGAFLKVSGPKGRGQRADEQDALKILHSRVVTGIDEAAVAKAIGEASGEYVRVGDFEHRPVNDSMVSVDMSEGEMKAFITVTPPGTGGCDISMETYLSFLRNNRVTFGVDENFLREFADRPVYKEKIAVAEGTRPVNGRDSYINYNFETDQSTLKLREGSNGRIDFKDLNIIKNVVETSPWRKKSPPKRALWAGPLPAR